MAHCVGRVCYWFGRLAVSIIGGCGSKRRSRVVCE